MAKKANKMVKTTPKMCKSCKYHCHSYSTLVYCDYYLITGNRRGCEVGECDKYEKGVNTEAKQKFKDFTYFSTPEDYRTWWWASC